MEPMARATADSVRTPQPIVEELTFTDEKVNRYLWFAAEDLPWPEIKEGFIRRCRVAPILPFPIWERINDVPEDMRIAVRKEWMDKEHQEAKYELRPQGIYDAIMNQYNHLGVRELTALRGMDPDRVTALLIDQTYCPWDNGDIPKPYAIIGDHIERTLRKLNKNTILQTVGEEMLASIAASRAYDEMLVDEEESRPILKYSRPGLRALSRLDRRRRDSALNDMAAAQNRVFDKVPEILAAQGTTENNALLKVLEMQNEQNRLLREELAILRQSLIGEPNYVAKGPGRPRKNPPQE